MIRIACAALMALVLFPVSAMAADTSVDLSGLVEPAAQIVVAVLGAFALWLARKAVDAFQERTGLELDGQLKQKVDDALFNAVQFGKAKVLTKVKGRQVTFDVRSEVLRHAISYAQGAVPEALAYFDIDQARLYDLLEARLGIDLDLDGDIAGRPA
ncbi:inadl protein [Roseibium sediminicola]|uniref:Inadl protein n=1 Tax=Roseibium sediminicola TaxID=2933272 RepID=A0ABT0H0F3_9HYPH|nr:inadl protein [Roseibium sp. CAU 1639]MCK7615167.1 inadl protein [Roseibium sp. CAU 1639]